MKRRCAAAALLILCVFLACGAGLAPERLIVVDADVQRVYFYREGELIRSWPCAVGKTATPSPLGVFRINGKHANWGTGFGTRFLSIDCPWGKYGIHGTNRPGSIGWNASHGCIRMLNRDVEELYQLVQIGTKVIIERSSFGNLADGLRVLRPGDRGSDVYELQLRLRNAGCYWGFPDGVFGEATRRALLCFRKECSLPEDDTADWAVYAALGMELFE